MITATNEYGTAEHRLYLHQADPPIFIEPFKEQMTVSAHGEDIHMTCKVDGIPYPVVKFYKDWRLLAESHRIKIRHVEPDTWTLSIRGGAIVRDSGLYTCTARNCAGATLSSCTLSVCDSLLNVSHADTKPPPLVLFKRKQFADDYELVEQLNPTLARVIHRRTGKEYLAKMAHSQLLADENADDDESWMKIRHK